MTQRSKMTETAEAIKVFPPLMSWTIVRESDPAIGSDWKKLPKILAAPVATNS